MAGFKGRQGNGRQRGGYPPQYGQQAPPGSYGAQGYGPGQPYGQGRSQGQAPSGEPEYYAPAPGYDDAPGGTRAFTLGGDAPLGGPHPAGPDGYYGGDDHVATYRAGQSTTPPVGPRLHWKDLLRGIVLHPSRTFWQMRDHKVWAPALIVTFVYGLLAVFGFDAARSDILNSTLSTSVPWVLTTGIAVVLCGFTLSAVTNTLARQLGGDGAWAPTIGLAMLITSLTDAPRLLFALFLGGGNGFVQLLGWLTWLGCAWLLTSMVSKSHDLPWLKALGAASIQLLALLILFKLPLI
ncbi:Yip1 domain-containing protein [Streptomyces sp. DvalAA-14]|uniref:Yip1 family protein n=1 Tax=unclassified Streptomyces TaxID=2593676 RepID=UPI00081B16C8|nr:Yip1 family protein [Streptomyces sp. DvalAA-14]MYS20830.1 YIP1 family protein [Streptomyces sp. SID4948]SCD78142.1 Yip1 domain-containing protein [Streptomyces sp. DvalAA-14]